MIKTDVCIIGAGPGGVATALKLSQLNIPCILIDKTSFPRDKICGDAISGKSTTILGRIDPSIIDRFEADQQIQTDVWGIRVFAPNHRRIDIPYRPLYNTQKDEKQGFVSKRIDFDNFLVEEVRKKPNIDFRENTAADVYEKTEDGYRVSNKKKTFEVETRLLILSNGAHSNFSRRHAGLEKDTKHHAGAVRAYYKNVGDMHPDGFIELHFLKEINPGYFWIFPLPGGYANVGLGMRSDFISKKKYNLRAGFKDVVDNHPMLKDRFKDAELVDKVTGFGLPLGSKKRPISGDHFMLVGDAGHLIDPFTGEGIGNAIYSGFIAAEQAQQCLEKQDFSAQIMKAYDVRVERVLGKEMQLSYALQRMMARNWLVNITANWVSRNRTLIDVISLMYQDLEVRKQAVNPMFWLRMLFGKVKVEDLRTVHTGD